MDSEYDRYIVVSFVDVTLVLSIGDTVEEADKNDVPRRSWTLLSRGPDPNQSLRVWFGTVELFSRSVWVLILFLRGKKEGAHFHLPNLRCQQPLGGEEVSVATTGLGFGHGTRNIEYN